MVSIDRWSFYTGGFKTGSTVNVVQLSTLSSSEALYLLYAKLEEDYGLARHAMAVYDRATKAVSREEQFDMFCVYLSRASEMFGITHTREIYEKGIEQLPDEGAR